MVGKEQVLSSDGRVDQTICERCAFKTNITADKSLKWSTAKVKKKMFRCLLSVHCTLNTKTDKSRIFSENFNHNSIKIHTCIHYNKKMYSITTVYKSVYMSSFSSAYLILGHRGIRAYPTCYGAKGRVHPKWISLSQRYRRPLTVTFTSMDLTHSHMYLDYEARVPTSMQPHMTFLLWDNNVDHHDVFI